MYKSYDPRATIIKQTADEVFAITGKNPLLDIALALEEVALSDDYFTSRKLYPNVDFYSGLIYQAMGFPIEMFTVLFAIPRAAGWLAHWVELLEQDQRIARPRQLYVGPGRARLRRPRPARLTAVHAVTIVDGALEWREHPDPEPGAGRGARGRARRRAQRRRPAPGGRLLPRPAGCAGRHPRAWSWRARSSRWARARPGSPIGDRVMAVVGGGGQAERAVVHERTAIPVPDGVSWAEAGGVPRGRSPPRTTRCSPSAGWPWASGCCVHGAAGGVGIAGVQLGAWPPARAVVATVRDPDRRAGGRGAHRRARPSTRRASPPTGPSTWSSSWSVRRTWPTTSRRSPPVAASP